MFLLALVHLASAAGLAQLPTCATLDPAGRARAEALASSQYLYDCCDQTVAECLAEPQPCRLAARVAEEICRHVADGMTDPAIEAALQLRARSMMPGGTRATIALDGLPPAGDPAAPVTVVAYVCLRCPFCAQMEPALVDAVTKGPLSGKARLYVKMFPLKSHPGSSQGALAALAASDQGRYYEFLRLAYREFDAFSEDRLATWAEQVGLDVAAWRASADAEAARAALVESKREGIANGVDATPTVYIDGRKYHARLEVEQIIDLIEEEYERVTGAER